VWEQLDLDDDDRLHQLFTERVPNPVWSEAMWRWSAETTAEWCLFLQDDASVAPNFWPILRAILNALPEDADVLGLQITHPACPNLAEEGVLPDDDGRADRRGVRGASFCPA
jgi:hypothetical protein